LSQETYLAVVRHRAANGGRRVDPGELTRVAVHWSLLRGARAGRVASLFVDDLAGRLGLAALDAGENPAAAP
jgi:predicted AAA+ superfamily ATPase